MRTNESFNKNHIEFILVHLNILYDIYYIVHILHCSKNIGTKELTATSGL